MWRLSWGRSFGAGASPFVDLSRTAAGRSEGHVLLVTCWSAKGGSGTTVVAASLAVLLSRRAVDDVLLVDAGGDIPAVLGMVEPSGAGLVDWLDAPHATADAIDRLEVDTGPGLRVVPRGRGAPPAAGDSGSRAERLVEALSSKPSVVIDAGPPSPFALALAAAAPVSLLVVRACYLALRSAAAASVRPTAVVLIEEPKRSLDSTDVEDVLGVPVRAIVPWDPAIARAADAGLLGSRLPRPIAAALRATA